MNEKQTTHNTPDSNEALEVTGANGHVHKFGIVNVPPELGHSYRRCADCLLSVHLAGHDPIHCDLCAHSRASVAAGEGDTQVSLESVTQIIETNCESYRVNHNARIAILNAVAAASSPAPAEPPPTCGPARPDDGSECLYGVCPRPRDGCSEYCWQHHKTQCAPLQPEGEQEYAPCPDPRCNDHLGAAPMPQCVTAVFWTEEAQMIADVLRSLSDQFNRVDNGYCTICHQQRLHDTKGKVQPCENAECPSRQISSILDRYEKPSAETLERMKRRCLEQLK